MKDTSGSFQNGLTLKSLLIALVLIPINVFWLIELEVVRYTFPTIIHPFSNVIFTVFWLLLIRHFLVKISPTLGISQQELLTVYVMLCFVSCLCSYDMMEILIPILGHPFRFATPENEWRELLWKHLPRWLTVQDETALTGFYEGGTNLYVGGYFWAWLIPAVGWIAFLFALMVVMLGLTTLLRVQWTERERLTYPLIQLPLEMTNPRSRFFKNRLMWFGFGLAALISIENLLNSIYPVFPYIPVKRQYIHQYFTDRPWNAMGSIKISFYPFVIGISFLMPLDLLFSCWVFYWIYKIELMIGNLMGWQSLPRFPYIAEQSFGVYLGLLAVALWTGRLHFKGLLRHLLSPRGSPSQLDDSREPMPYRLAFACIVLGTAFLTIFSYKAGMALWVIPLFFGIYFLLGTMIARLRAEMGFLCHDFQNHVDPHHMIIDAFGTRRLGAGSLTVFTLYMHFTSANRTNLMPEQLEAFKISERRNINPRHTAVAIALATLIGAAVTFWFLLDNYYRHGAESGYYMGPTTQRGWIYTHLESWLTDPQGTDSPALAFMGGGLGIAVLLMFLRARFLWWSLHPLGYAMADSWGMYNLWSCLFVAWGLKALILHYGGLNAYRRAIPFFLGLALGDYMLSNLWGILSILTNTPLYQFFP
ncbi:MAG: hypothetical protein O7E52_11840 [Candidatus Poribacteria bacterium]|nr:hypothetical protein [Candidatus Poribacteria bacterium]